MANNRTTEVAILRIKTSARPAVKTPSALHLMVASSTAKPEVNMVNMMPAIHKANPTTMALRLATLMRRTNSTSNSGRRGANNRVNNHMEANTNSPNNLQTPTLPTMIPTHHPCRIRTEA
ncbi:uncharacterized protein A1O9_08407 [Exophiala aquamarina CBS 119918]|uniref:Uncharacterized protein n=1 Tax=Exophiala aquamarina CBS 119918 TaxID=1182545 RepID=A0A072P7F5_9EURO|nr:uncharacterized protein A1O9_08407 [Exophiala aquamarina CBS 119918]KEF55657.1 hypothetical protein A1O9_08407 [Exophiala aquamarina CBS 119918]